MPVVAACSSPASFCSPCPNQPHPLSSPPSPAVRQPAEQRRHPPAGRTGGAAQPPAAATGARGPPGQPAAQKRGAASVSASAAPAAAAAAAGGAAASRPSVPAGCAGRPPVRPPHDFLPPAHRGPVCCVAWLCSLVYDSDALSHLPHLCPSKHCPTLINLSAPLVQFPLLHHSSSNTATAFTTADLCALLFKPSQQEAFQQTHCCN